MTAAITPPLGDQTVFEVADRHTLVLLIEQGREVCNLLTELPAPVGDGTCHGEQPICPQDPECVHDGQWRSELLFFLEQTAVLVQELVDDSRELAAGNHVPGLAPTVAIAQRWLSFVRASLAGDLAYASALVPDAPLGVKVSPSPRVAATPLAVVPELADAGAPDMTSDVTAGAVAGAGLS